MIKKLAHTDRAALIRFLVWYVKHIEHLFDEDCLRSFSALEAYLDGHIRKVELDATWGPVQIDDSGAAWALMSLMCCLDAPTAVGAECEALEVVLVAGELVNIDGGNYESNNKF